MYLILPGNTDDDSSLSILRARRRDYAHFEVLWAGSGYDGEPCVDVQSLELSDTLSIFTRTDGDGDGKRDVVVLNFQLHQ